MLIDWFTVGAQIVNFLILVWLLKRYLYKPVLAAIDAREKRIAAQIADAESKKADAAREQDEFRKKSEEFDRQRDALLRDAVKAANDERVKLMQTARDEVEALRSGLTKAANDERDQLNAKIATLVQQEVFSICWKTLADLADASVEERITDMFIRRLSALNDTEKEALRQSFQASPETATIRSGFAISTAQQAAIRDAIRPLVGEGREIAFVTQPDLIGGIECATNGHKIGWSIRDYLTSLSGAVDAMLKTKPEAAARAA